MRKKKNKKTVADTGYKKVDRKEKKKKEKQEEKRRQKKLSVQQSIAYKEMGRDGICRVQGKTYSKCIRFYDINYQLAQNEDKNAIFENWCDFLNYFDASIHFQLSFINHKSSMKEFEQVIRIRPQEDAFDDVRMEYAKMLKQQLAKGNNGLVKSKYITFSIEADNIREAKPKLERIESDILNNFKKQKWETYETKAEAKRRKKEIEYKKEMGSFVVRKCKTLDELITEYVALYGKENWALSTYEGNVSLINNYILPIIGDTKLSEINTRFIERYYQSLLKRRAVINPLNKTSRNEFVSSSTVRDINKLLRNCFEQAVKWELMEKNPCIHATVPKHKSQKRDIWTADTLMYALSVCEDERLKLAINLSFSCSLRLGELLGLTWDCVDISPEAIEENRAYVFINKESQRIRKESLNALDGKDVLLVFPTNHKKNSTVRILKTPKTESSVRKIFLPKSVANMLVDWKAEQDEMKEILGDEYMDYNLVMASTFGLPLGDGAIRGPLKKLIEDYNLPPVVFHSFRHSSVTYKLKLNGGDIKAVQGDSGHAQVNMVTDVYSHILDDDRRKNAELFEEAFYEKKNLDPQMHVQQENNNATVADEVDPELLAKVLANPEMRALLNSLAKTMK